MKRLIILSLVIFFSSSFSHPPSNIEINYDIKTKELTISINHTVRDVKDHYIDKIILLLNDKKIIEQNSTIQIDNSKQIYKYIIPDLKLNDRITITAKCNKFGTLKRDFVIKDEQENKQWSLL